MNNVKKTLIFNCLPTSSCVDYEHCIVEKFDRGKFSELTLQAFDEKSLVNKQISR